MRKIQFGILAFIVIAVMGCSQETETKNLQSASTPQSQVQVGAEYIELHNLFLKAHKYYKNQDFNQAFEKMMPIAEKGHAKAQMVVGVMYLEGQGVNKNVEEGKKWMEMSAQQGLPAAQMLMGRLYVTEPKFKNMTKAESWLDKAAKNGDWYGYLMMGEFYLTGEYVEQDPNKAIEWFNKANHLPFAQYKLGLIYYFVKNDKDKAKFWLEKASNQNYQDAEVFLQKNFSK